MSLIFEDQTVGSLNSGRYRPLNCDYVSVAPTQELSFMWRDDWVDDKATADTFLV